MKDSTNAQVIFPFAPAPFSGESIASWVIRLCNSHGYGFATVEKLVKVKLKNKDWDEGMTDQDTHALLQAAGLEYEQFFDGILDPRFLRENNVKLWPRSKDRRPYYGFCKLCFKEDLEPYLRWRWRYENFRDCAEHHCKLLTSCPHCEERIYTDSVILRDDSRSVFIPNVGYCKQCGQPLYEDIKSFGAELKNANRPIGYKAPDINPFDRRSILNWLWHVKKGRVRWKLKFGFAPEPDPFWAPRKNGLKQYRNLNLFSRIKVAKAVGIYRAEKHRQRAEERLAAQAAESAK
jgi:TniQ